jgi:hypothetical protein
MKISKCVVTNFLFNDDVLIKIYFIIIISKDPRILKDNVLNNCRSFQISSYVKKKEFLVVN